MRTHMCLQRKSECMFAHMFEDKFDCVSSGICLPMCVLSALLVSMCVCVCVCEPSDCGRGQPERSSLMCLGGPGESRALEGVDVSALRDL